MSFPFDTMMNSSESIPASRRQIDNTSSQGETMMETTLERRDDGEERQDSSESSNALVYAYRFVDYAYASQRRSDGSQCTHWDEIMDLHQSIEARDDDNRGDHDIHSQAVDQTEVIVHKTLLRRRHIRKLQKERAAKLAFVNSATTQGPAVATSPIQKKSTLLPPITIPNTTTAPRAFFGGQAPTHSPIQVRKSVDFVSHFKACDSKKHSLLPVLSPVRCPKRLRVA